MDLFNETKGPNLQTLIHRNVSLFKLFQLLPPELTCYHIIDPLYMFPYDSVTKHRTRGKLYIFGIKLRTNCHFELWPASRCRGKFQGRPEPIWKINTSEPYILIQPFNASDFHSPFATGSVRLTFLSQCDFYDLIYSKLDFCYATTGCTISVWTQSTPFQKFNDME